MRTWILIGTTLLVLFWWISPDQGSQPADFSAGDPRVDLAKTLVGSPYQAGGNSPEGFDCSGFTSYVFEQCGSPIPRDSRSQWLSGTKVEPGNELAGDLIFFTGSDAQSREVGHVGIIIEGQGSDMVVVHACNRGVVRERILDLQWYRDRLMGIRRM